MSQGDATLDMAEVHYSSGGNNLFVSLAAELQRVGMPFKSTVVFGSPDTGSVCVSLSLSVPLSLCNSRFRLGVAVCRSVLRVLRCVAVCCNVLA